MGEKAKRKPEDIPEKILYRAIAMAIMEGIFQIRNEIRTLSRITSSEPGDVMTDLPPVLSSDETLAKWIDKFMSKRGKAPRVARG